MGRIRTTEIMGRTKVWINGKKREKKEKKYYVGKKTQIEKIWKMLRKDIGWVIRLNNTMHYTVL